jgi:hypothetical protein
LIITGIVADGALAPAPPADEPLELLELLELCAIGLTWVIRPPTVSPLGSSTLTGSPTTASLCLVASRSTVTSSWFDVVWRIASADDPADPVPPALPVEEPVPEDPLVLVAADEAAPPPPVAPDAPPLLPAAKPREDPAAPEPAAPEPAAPEPAAPEPVVEERDDPLDGDSVLRSSSVSACSSASSTASSDGFRLPDFAEPGVLVRGVISVFGEVVVALASAVSHVEVGLVVVGALGLVAGVVGVVVVGVTPGWEEAPGAGHAD